LGNTKIVPDGSWHQGVTRQTVIDEALRILDQEGRQALTMRRLATALHVEAPSLYAHIRSKDELVDAVLDSVLDGVVLPEVGPDVRVSLLDGFGSYRRALVRHPAIVLLMTERARFSSAQLRLARRSIELLEAAGLSTRDAVDAQVAAVAFVLGFILQEVSRPRGGPPATVADELMTSVLTALRERSVDERFEVGLGLIFDGAGVPRHSA
jgi:AcrR family transcriptional regulator